MSALYMLSISMTAALLYTWGFPKNGEPYYRPQSSTRTATKSTLVFCGHSHIVLIRISSKPALYQPPTPLKGAFIPCSKGPLSLQKRPCTCTSSFRGCGELPCLPLARGRQRGQGGADAEWSLARRGSPDLQPEAWNICMCVYVYLSTYLSIYPYVESSLSLSLYVYIYIHTHMV